jgi:hypothetical protein
METHLRSHGYSKSLDGKIHKGEAVVPASTFAHQWSQDGQKRATESIAKWVAKDRLAPNIVAGEGCKTMMHELLGGRLRTPVPSTIAAHTDKLKGGHDTKLSGFMHGFA